MTGENSKEMNIEIIRTKRKYKIFDNANHQNISTAKKVNN